MKQKKWNPNDVIKAVKFVQNKKMGYLNASKVLGMSKGIVLRYLKCVTDPKDAVKIPNSRQPIVSPKLETELVQYALSMEDHFFLVVP